MRQSCTAVFCGKELNMPYNKQVSAADRKKTISDKEEGYRLAKLLRSGNRELMRQLNSKKTKRDR